MNDIHSSEDLLHAKIALILERFPYLAETFIAYRLACVGCSFSRFHTLQQAIEIYHLQDTQFFKTIRELIGGSIFE